MKKAIMLVLSGLVFAGCGQTPQNVSINASNTNVNKAVVQSPDNSITISSHSGTTPDLKPAANSNDSKSANSKSAPQSPGGSPMAKAIDVSAMTATIEKAEKSFKAKPNDEKAKHDLAEAYFVRAFALTEAAQYRSALGDFRKGLKLNPENQDAKAMHDQIISIFQSIGREPPKEGEEPPPLPFGKS